MTQTHTPGPWRVSTSGNVIADQPDGGHIFIASPKHPEQPTVEHPMREANAALIAAAPDLLAALRAVDMECREIGGGDVSIPSYIMDLIMQAIAKAEGRS